MKNLILIAAIIYGLFSFHENEILHAQEFYSAERLPFNSKIYDDFSPTYYKEGIIFCSNRKNDFIISYTDTANIPLIDLYFSSKKKNENWTNPNPLAAPINTNFQEGPACVSEDEKTIFFTRNIIAQKKFGNFLRRGNTMGIFISMAIADNWGEPVAFRWNSEDYNVMHPAISRDGKLLYFTSDMPGGYGGYDLYISENKGGAWTKPENLGPIINTSGNEVFPFSHPDGRLMFSSDDHQSLGKLDLFYSRYNGSSWEEPYHFKAPFNSKQDDFGLIADEKFESGYFSSNRSNSDDVYMFNYLLPTFDNCNAMKINNYCFTFYEERANSLDSTSLKYQWDLGDGTKVMGLYADHCYKTTGTYQIQLNIIDTLTGDVFFNEAMYDFLLEDIEQPYISMSDSVYINEIVNFSGKNSFIKQFKIENYIWDFGDNEKAVGLEQSHKYTKPGNYNVQLGITGIADSTGYVPKLCSYRVLHVLTKP